MSRRTRFGSGLLVALACLLMGSCTATESTTQQADVPTSRQLAANIAQYAQTTSDFDQVRAILVARGDDIVHEQYFGTDADAYWGLQSVTKSVISTLIGIAVGEGLIGGLDDTLGQLLPEYVEDMSPAVQQTTLRQLLTMTAGFPADSGGAAPAFTTSDNWVREILATPAAPPGGQFAYASGTSHLLSAILEQATGTSALAYARSHLFGPLGIDTTPAFRGQLVDQQSAAAYDQAGFAWPVDPQGVSTGWFGLRLRPQDLLKLGQLYLDGGRWDGRPIVPEDWVDEATRQQVPAQGNGEGYGYQWWTGDLDGEPSYRAMGYGGQMIAVVPSRDLVVVTATEVRFADATSHGIAPAVLTAIVEDAIVSEFGPA